MSGEHLRDMLFPKHSFNVTTASENETVPAPGTSNYQKHDIWRQLLTQLKDVPTPSTPDDLGRILVFRPHKQEATDKDRTEVTYSVAWEDNRGFVEGEAPILVEGEGGEFDPYIITLNLSNDPDNILRLDDETPAGLFAGNSILVYDPAEKTLEFTDNLGQTHLVKLSNLIEEAPEDGEVYGREDASWTKLGSAALRDVGTDPDQVPMNAHLGELAYLDRDDIDTGDSGKVDSVVGSETISVDNTDEENPVVSVKVSEDEGNTLEVKADGLFSEGGGGEEFDIMELPTGLIVAEGDFIPMAQAPEASARYWRIRISANLGGETLRTSNRLYEIQFRDVEGTLRLFSDEVITGERMTSLEDVIDNNTSTYSTPSGGLYISELNPYGFSVDYGEPFNLREVAIYYPPINSGGRNAPGRFVIEYSHDDIIWQEWLSVHETDSTITSAGWYTFSPDTTYTTRKIAISTLVDYIVGEVITALDQNNGD